MSVQTENLTAPGQGGALRPPARLHHNNFYSNDLEATRHFYEDIAGMPLRAFWVELTEGMPGGPQVLGHAFFGLADDSMMAFMQFSSSETQASMVGTEQPGTVHIAVKVDAEQQQELLRRLKAEGYAPGTDYFEIDHGFVNSVYVWDPDRLLVEFAVDPADAEEIWRVQGQQAHEVLRKYIAGDRTPTAPKKS